MKTQISLAAAAVLLSGCATILEGTSQEIAIVVNPSGASCQASRAGQPLAQIAPGGATIHVDKSRHNIELNCAFPNYKTANVTVPATVSPGGVASIVFVDFGAVDYVTGALNSYPEKVSVTLEPEQPHMPEPAKTVPAQMKPVR